MPLPPLLPNRVLLDLAANSKRAILTWVAQAAARDMERAPAGVLDALQGAERANPSAIGGGIALSHFNLDYLEQPYFLVARLTHKVDFQAPDNQPVDLLWLFVAPAEDRMNSLRRLGILSRMARDAALLSRLRSATTPDAVQALFIPLGEQADIRAA